jgi:hypothetical protein
MDDFTNETLWMFKIIIPSSKLEFMYDWLKQNELSWNESEYTRPTMHPKIKHRKLARRCPDLKRR